MAMVSIPHLIWLNMFSGLVMKLEWRRAVEELIQQNLMSREDALKFLHEIRVGIEYLQKSYANRIFPEEIKYNTMKKSYLTQPLSTTTSSTTTSTTTATTLKPTLPYLSLEKNINDPGSNNIAKALDSISLWRKLQAMNNAEGRQDVLLQALSDTLTEKPELWPAAQYPYNRLLRSYAYELCQARPSNV
ncbi:hypothetical protein EVAR_71492_1 [Eumeta japonica]|uniref:Uncharacterized protein n=1 Tax=Eumeta variegata TaxID=151549 RepID=A0A4C2AFE9_EUMVA|nr:hypothetical protein EVAR_71492_1 [Eumeta japonica]